MPSEEVCNASLDDGYAEVEAKGLRTFGGPITGRAPGHSAGFRRARPGARLWVNHGGRGVCVSALEPPLKPGRPMEEMPKFQTGPGKTGRPGL